MQSLAAIKPGETSKNTIYIAFSISLLVFVVSLVQSVQSMSYDLIILGTLIAAISPIIAWITYYSRIDENWIQNKIKDDLLEGSSEIERFLTRINFLFKTWETSIAVDPNPDSAIEVSFESTIQGSDMRDDLWFHRISVFARIIIGFIILSLALTVRQSLSIDNQQISIILLIILIMDEFVLGFILGYRVRKFSRRMIFFSLIIMILVGVLIPLLGFWKLYEIPQFTAVLVAIQFVPVIDYAIRQGVSDNWNETVTRAFAITKMRILQRLLTHEQILFNSETQPDLVKEKLRESIMNEIKVVEESVLRSDWAIAIERIDRLVGIVSYIAYETIDGHRPPRLSLLNELKTNWKNIFFANAQDAWPKMIWLRYLAKRMIDLHMQPRQRIEIIKILKLNPDELSDSSFYVAVFGKDDDLPFEIQDETLSRAKLIVDGQSMTDREVMDWDSFLSEYIVKIKGWKYYVGGRELLARAALQSLRHPDMQDAFRGAIRRNPDDIEAYIDLGYSLLNQSQHSEAKVILETAAKIEEDYAFIHFGLGLCQESLHLYDEAEKSYKRCIELESEFTPAYTNLANVYERKEKYNEAEAILNDAKKVDPDDYDIEKQLAEFLTRRGRLNEAEDIYTAFIDKQPSIEVLAEYGIWLNLVDRHDEALAVCNKLKDMQIVNVRNQRHYGRLLRHCGQHQDAENVIRNALKLSDDSTLLYMELGKVHLSLKKFEEAIQTFDIAREKGYDTYELYLGFGKAYHGQGKLELAEASLRLSIKTEESFPGYAALGDVLRDSKKLTDAVNEYQKSLNLLKSNISRRGLSIRISIIDEMIQINEGLGHVEAVTELRIQLADLHSVISTI